MACLRVMRHTLALFLLIATPLPAAGETLAGRHVLVDADSIGYPDLVDEARLHWIDAVEKWQPETRYAKTVLAKLIGDKPVVCQGDERDDYTDHPGHPKGRLIAVCKAGRTNLNKSMVRAGAAFAYWPFRSWDTLERLPCPDQARPECHRTNAEILRLEDEARAAKRGMWGFVKLPEYPWCARHRGACPKRGS